MMRTIVVLAFVGLALADSLWGQPALDAVKISAHNRDSEATWVAGVNERFVGATLKDVKKLLGVLPGGPKLPVAPQPSADDIINLPTEWDARKVWGAKCPSVSEVRDQANCGSCWAFGAVEAMTDRICINSNGTVQVHISAEDMNSCCDSCGDGCGGGFPGAAWQYWQDTGLVDGNNYKVNPGQSCYPYSIPNCDHHTNGTGKYGPCPAEQDTPNCESTCSNGKSWSSSKHKAAKVYSPGSSESAIMNDIANYGPVEADFTVYQDFLSYKSGVYSHKWGGELGGHAIKILGWGVDGSTKYWIVANSWNEDWGNAGFFNIVRGRDECGIESDINAGLPRYP